MAYRFKVVVLEPAVVDVQCFPEATEETDSLVDFIELDPAHFPAGMLCGRVIEFSSSDLYAVEAIAEEIGYGYGCACDLQLRVADTIACLNRKGRYVE